MAPTPILLLFTFSRARLDNIVGASLDVGDTRKAGVALGATLSLLNNANASNAPPMRRRAQDSPEPEPGPEPVAVAMPRCASG